MRLFYFSFIIVLLASCGTMNQHQLRFVKVDQKEVPVIVKNTSETTQHKEIDITSNGNQEGEIAVLLEKSEEIPFTQEQSIKEEKVLIKGNLEDLEPEDEELDENQMIVDQALLAEKKAINSVGFAGAGLISILMPLLGFLFFIIGLILYSKANSSRYITPFGEQKLKTTRTFLIIDTVFLSIWLFLFLLLLVVFIL